MTDKELDILTNIIGAVETGGQIYGKRRYDCYVAPYTNSQIEYTCTLGWWSCYGDQAQLLVENIKKANESEFKKYDKANIADKLNVSWVATKWYPSEKEVKSLVDIISSPTGKLIQDSMFKEHIKTCIAKAISYDTSMSVSAQIMWCEISILGGTKAAQRIFDRITKPYTVDSIMESLKKDQLDNSSNNQVGDSIYFSRHECCAKWIKQYLEIDNKGGNTMGLIVGSARMDENNFDGYEGSLAGDQTGIEVSMQDYYMHTKGWYLLRPKSASHATKIAQAMIDACNNEHIGYSQPKRNIMTYLKRYGSMKAIAENCETDCSNLVRGCIYQGTGVDTGDFYTANQVTICQKTGLFEETKSVTSSTVLYNGDILVTKTTGHTVIVVSGNPRKDSATTTTTTTKTETWKATGTATCTDNGVNVRKTPGGTILGQVHSGNRFEVDGTKIEKWVHVKVANIGIGYIHEDYVKKDGATTTTTTTSKPTTTTTTTKPSIEKPKSKTLFTISGKSSPNETEKFVGKVTTNDLNVRKWAGTENGLISSYPKLNSGNLVSVCDSILAKDGSRWYYIKIAGKYNGFVCADWIVKG